MGSYRNAKVLWKSCVEHHSFFCLHRPYKSPKFHPLLFGSKFYYSGRTQLQAQQESKKRSTQKLNPKEFVRSPSKRLLTVTPVNGSSESNGKSQKLSRPHDNKVTSKQSSSIPRKAWELQSDDDGGFIERCARSYDSNNVPPLYNTDPATPVPTDENLVTIRLTADSDGRFGFNVKGGIDLKLPVLVSRVAPHTPADRCTPRICEGDQVLMINGRDVSSMKHEQVVNLIRASREYRNGELVLTIRPNALVNFSEEEPLYQYVPEGDIGHLPHFNGDALFTQSLLLLSDGLGSGTLLNQYEQMYRKNPDLVITEAKKQENITKNRYRDISPCKFII